LFVPTPSPTAERREAMLGELGEWLHAAAHKTQRKLMESEDTDEVVRLAGSLTKLARGVRQCVLMHDRLESGRLKAESAAAMQQADAEAEVHATAVSRLKSRVGRAVGRRFEGEWPETEDLDDNDEFDGRLDHLNERLDDLSETEAFLSQDPDTLIAKLCEEFGVTPPATSPNAAALAGGGPSAERSEEPMVEGASPIPKANGHAPPNTS
jgi:hypothetical protein